MPLVPKRDHSGNHVKAPETAQDVPRMALRPRKVRILSPPAQPEKSRTKRASKKDAVVENVDAAEEEAEKDAEEESKLEKASSPERNGDHDGEEVGGILSNEETRETDDDSDSDAAPETISLSTSQAVSRKRSAQESRATQEREAKSKQKRRERDSKLKAQAAERSKKAVPAEAPEFPNNSEEDRRIAPLNTLDGTSQSEMLPQHILDALPTPRAPGPSAGVIVTKSSSSDQKLTKPRSQKLPQDLVVNSRMTVAVLTSKSSGTLPPPVAHKRQLIRADLLLGRPYHIQTSTGKRKRADEPRLRVTRRPWGRNDRFC
jgi:hypothetical protein